MGTFLVYIIKSGFCLMVFYIFFRLLLSRTTFFRFNRIAILVGITICILLPFVNVTTHNENPLHIPLQTIQQVLDGDIEEKELVQKPLVTNEEGQEELVTVKNLLPVMVGGVYWIGVCTIFVWLLISVFRMCQLIRNADILKQEGYRLAVVRQPICPFSWGRYIVISKEDYHQYSDEIVLHEIMHLRCWHTLDLLYIKFFLLFYWWNPAAWLLKRDLQELHEYEADNSVLTTGIDATKYQLLLVKKAVGTRLYSMANGFNHSKLKNRITMMLKKRTNRWAHLKLLLFVPVTAATLFVFAQPEVNETLSQAVDGVEQQKTADNYLSLNEFFDKEMESYVQRINGKKTRGKVTPLYINMHNKILFNGNLVEQKDLQAVLVKDLRTAWEKSSRKETQILAYTFDRSSDMRGVEEILRSVKGAYIEIRKDIEQESNEKGKEYLDRVFPILVSESLYKDYGKLLSEQTISGVTVKIFDSSDKQIELKDFTLEELKDKLQGVKAASKDSNELVISLKVDTDSKMGVIADIKEILRKAGALKVNLSGSMTIRTEDPLKK